MVIGDLGHVKDFDNPNSGHSHSVTSNRAFGTNNYLAPEAHDLKRTNKIDIWSFGCIVYELFNLEKLFSNKDYLRGNIRNFQVETDLKPGKMRPLYIRVVKKYVYLYIVWFDQIIYRKSSLTTVCHVTKLHRYNVFRYNVLHRYNRFFLNFLTVL